MERSKVRGMDVHMGISKQTGTEAKSVHEKRGRTILG